MEENLNEYVTTIKRSELENYYTPPTGNCIIIPIEFYKMTEDMVRLEGETQGVLLCNESNSFLIVNSIINIGFGSSGGVRANPARVRAMNRLMFDNTGSGLRMIDFHTHTVSTPRYYDDKFSDFKGGGGDFGSFRKAMMKNPNYIHVLFTPTHILTFGKSKPSLELSNKENPDVLKLYRHWNKEFDKKLLLEK